MLNHFGLFFTHSRVAIFVEPEMDGLDTNQARSLLITKKNEQLPWQQWGWEFKNNLPEPIKKIEDAWQREHQEWIEDSGKLDHLDSICRRLSREIHELDKKGADPSGLQSDQAKVLAALLRDKRARFAAEQESLLRANHELKQVKDRQKQYQLHQRGLLLRSSVLHYQNAMQ